MSHLYARHLVGFGIVGLSPSPTEESPSSQVLSITDGMTNSKFVMRYIRILKREES
ncbi:hypothetical protein COCC4DRAFT_35208 [Bipolaris maydis ATCC 48331]|uniref:Uncharacterized protein n=2 Tax=Cochliobolus heterostrophus TaxID=5016 RepID=M2V4U2_COCH5|nr:uncharacterized protein COCC4DRAFT_35208 [Bipolaris maydis ATCC 48331]EMD95007.1 hypothetical protein COCHEDRAFT_1019888 [Bipolaris maydis C5]ENH98522.1 hypothetical protein COCC4DRAFT_35208 [Bipolaris maydis ATCC 48331]